MSIKNNKKPKIRKQNIKGVQYVYEDHPYWDSEKKQTRHKREYIGKIGNNGEFIPNKSYADRQELDKVVKQKNKRITTPSAKRTFYGATYLLDSIGNSTGITADLKACFPDDYKKIMSAAYFLILEDDRPLYRFAKWGKTHFHPLGENLISQKSSELFESISENAKMSFFKRQCKRHLEDEYLAYDTTSISSYSELISHVKHVKNKDGEQLPQVNLAMVFGEKSMLPVYYYNLPGNISNVKTVTKLLKDVNFLKNKKLKFVFDGGFCSNENVNNLYSKHYKFIVPARCNLKFVTSLLNDVRESIKDFKNYSINQDIYCVSSMEKWPYKKLNKQGEFKSKGYKRIYVHIYYNGHRAEIEKAKFIKSLALAKDALQEGTANEKQNNLARKYFTIKETPIRGLKIKYNEEAITEGLSNCGYFILLSNDIKKPKIALEVYRYKDIIEKAFVNLKYRLNINRTGVDSSENLEGKLFVQFIALIYISYIHKCMKENNLYQNYSMNTLLDEIDVIERFDDEEQKYHCSAITKKQKEIYTCFNVEPPNIL